MTSAFVDAGVEAVKKVNDICKPIATCAKFLVSPVVHAVVRAVETIKKECVAQAEKN